MVRIVFESLELEIPAGNNLLRELVAAGIDIPSGCRSGVCQGCLVRVNDGDIPSASQRGLSRKLVRTRHMLACQCWPELALFLQRAAHVPVRYTTRLLEKFPLNDNILCVRLERPAGFAGRAGQYVTLWRDPQQGRSYSLVNSQQDDWLEFHVRVYQGGAVSEWLASELAPGDTLMLQGPSGDCGYDKEIDKPLLLIGAGVGIGAMYGVLREALAAGHALPITIFHSVRQREDLYLEKPLSQLANAQVEYRHFIGSGLSEPTALEDELAQIASRFAACHIQLCGSPQLVLRLRRQLYLAGASADEILADPFEFPMTASILPG